MESCLFCKIANKEIPSTIVYEDSTVIALLDIHPVNIGHTLVITKNHYKNFYEIPDALMGKIFSVVKKLGVAVNNGVKAEGTNIILNNDPASGRLIDHLHIHIIPRYLNDGFEEWHGVRGYREGEADIIAQKIIANVQ